MVRRLDKVLEATHSEVVPEVVPNSSRDASETLVPKLFNIDPRTEPKRPIHIDLNLDQLEDAEE